MRWRYPLSDIDLGKEEEREVLRVLRSGWLSTGPVTEKFEKAFSDYLGRGDAIAVSSGTAALHLALASLDLKEEDEVILPSLTFLATANAVLYVGARPVFADIRGLDDLNISPREIEKRVTKRTKAILVMHYGGYPCDMELILEIARKYDLRVVEDAAHAPGSNYKGRKCGAIGDIGCFSFFPNKNLATGEGGMVFTRNRTFAEKIRRKRSHGMETLSWDKMRGHASAYDIRELGYNYRTTEIQSAIGLVQLRKLDRNNRIRKRLTEIYREELSGTEGISIPFSKYRASLACHIFPMILATASDRAKVREGLRGRGIQTSIHYPPVHLFTLYRSGLGYQDGSLPRTEEASRRELTLPLHPRMKVSDAKWIAEEVKKIVRKI